MMMSFVSLPWNVWDEFDLCIDAMIARSNGHLMDGYVFIVELCFNQNWRKGRNVYVKPNERYDAYWTIWTMQ